jgi:hypothetical protein
VPIDQLVQIGVILFLSVNDLLGPGVLFAFAAGRYHNPRKMPFVNLNAKNQIVGLVTGKIVKGAWLTSNWVRRILAARHQRRPSEQPVPVLEAPQQARVAWALFEGRPVCHSNCCHTF